MSRRWGAVGACIAVAGSMLAVLYPPASALAAGRPPISAPISVAPVPDHLVVVGRVVDAAGRPVSHGRVRLETDEGLFGALSCLFSFGLIDPGCLNVPSTRTDAAGRFRFVLSSDWFGPRIVDASGTRHVAGLLPAHTSRSVGVGRPVTGVGTLRLWEPSMSAARAAGRITFTTGSPPSGAKHGSVVLTAERHREAWATGLSDSDHTATVDDRVAETGVHGWSATVRRDGTTYTSPEQAVPVAGTPNSRGRTCSGDDGRGNVAPFAPRCPFTDGVLGAGVPIERQGLDLRYAFGTSLDVDLGSVQLLSAVVIRGCNGCVVDVSADGATWQQWPGQQQERGASDEAVVTGVPLPVRYVRLQGRSGFLRDFREVSVWADALPVAGGSQRLVSS